MAEGEFEIVKLGACTLLTTKSLDAFIARNMRRTPAEKPAAKRPPAPRVAKRKLVPGKARREARLTPKAEAKPAANRRLTASGGPRRERTARVGPQRPGGDPEAPVVNEGRVRARDEKTERQGGRRGHKLDVPF